jgi:hypothetical protein
MIDTERVFLWAWDARMVPRFPEDSGLWADAENWDRGHWVSGRLGAAPARETVEQIFADYGFGDGTVEPIGSVVDALIADRVLSARQLLEAAAAIHGFDAVESEGRIAIRGRFGRTRTLTVGLEDLVEPADGAAADRYVETRAQETELPDVVKVSYGEPTSDDQPAAVEARRLAGRSRRTVEQPLAAVMHEGKARAIAEAMLHEAWAGREALELALPPSLMRLEPGDVVGFAPTGESFRLVEIADAEARRVSAVRIEAALFDSAGGAANLDMAIVVGTGTSTGGTGTAAIDAPRRSRPPASSATLGKPLSVFLDGPLLGDDHVPHAGYVAAFPSPWPGGVAMNRSPSDSGFVVDQVLPVPARMGVTAFDYFAGPVWRWDRGNELWVDLFSGTLESADELQVLGGANAIAVENADGEWEIVQFATADLMAAGRYRLKDLLRGQRGSEHAMRNPVAAGARVLVLDLAVSQPAIATDLVGLPLTWKIGPASRDIADPSYDTKVVTLTGRGRRPLSPARVKGVRPDGSDDIVLTWIRRTRIGGDSWGQEEVPLGEESERYDVEIFDGSDVVRTFSALSAPTVTYTAAQQTADFGAPIAWPSSLSLRVYQRSASFGRGTALQATLFFPLPVEV